MTDNSRTLKRTTRFDQELRDDLMNRKYPDSTCKFRLFSAMLFGSLLVAGCASKTSKPIIDPEGVDMAQYESDLAKCEQVAEQVEQKAGNEAVSSAVVWGAIGAIFGDAEGAAMGAAAGAVKGGAEGSQDTNMERSKVVKNCLRSRGYNVLN